MKKNFILTSILVVLLGNVLNAQVQYRVVFDMTSKDTVNQIAVLRQAGLIREMNPDSKVEVVIYGQGLDLVTNNGTAQQNAVAKLIAEKGISFKVCAVTMKRNNLDKSRLVPGVEMVPDGIYEIITKQHEGWGYIKVSH